MRERFSSLSLAVAALLVTVVSGCGGARDSESPPELVYGEDACRQCVMIINEARYAAGYVDAEGMSQGFDDVGCVLQLLRDEELPNTLWVVDHTTGEWSKADDAFFVQSNEIISPMGYGIAAFSSESAAREMTGKVSGDVLRFAQLQADDQTAE